MGLCAFQGPPSRGPAPGPTHVRVEDAEETHLAKMRLAEERFAAELDAAKRKAAAVLGEVIAVATAENGRLKARIAELEAAAARRDK